MRVRFPPRALIAVWLPLTLLGTVVSARAQQPESLDEFLARPECRTSEPDSAPNLIDVAARGSGEVEPEFFCFAIDSAVYGLNVRGEGTVLRPDSARRAFSVPVKEGDAIEGLMYKRYGNTLYLFYEVGNGEGSNGQFDAFGLPTLKRQWAKGVHTTFNLSPVLLADTVAYLSSLDFVAKVDLRRGRVLWRHLLDVRGVREGRHFESFYAPNRVGRVVRFPENAGNPLRKSRPDTLIVDDLTGRIVAPAGVKTVRIPW